MKEVFRKKALDKIASPEQLDKVMKITSPMSWAALLAATVIIVFVLVWSIVGSLPTTVTAMGVIVSANTSTNTITAGQRGTVQGIIAEGSYINEDSVVIELKAAEGEDNKLYKSGQVGIVSELLVEQGQTVDNVTEILRIRPQTYAGQKEVAVCYVPVSDADKIERGMEANITLTAADSNVYGHIIGRVINVDDYPASQKAMAAVVGSDNSMAAMLNSDGKAVCAVTCEFFTDDDPQSKNGYRWSNAKGKTKEINAPLLCSVRIVTERVAPITKLFAKLKDIWENK